MMAVDLMLELQRRGVKLSSSGEQLHYRAPEGSLTPELRKEVSKHKVEILRFLRMSSQAFSLDSQSNREAYPAQGLIYVDPTAHAGHSFRQICRVALDEVPPAIGGDHRARHLERRLGRQTGSSRVQPAADAVGGRCTRFDVEIARAEPAALCDETPKIVQDATSS